MSLDFKGPDELDLTSGGIRKPLLYLSLPLVITTLLQTAYNLADTYWVGQYGTAELAAISFAFPMVFLFLSIGIGLSIAGSVLVAQNTGANNQQTAEYAAAQTMTVTIVASIILGAISYVIAKPLLLLFGAEPHVATLAASYLQIISLGLVFLFGFFLFISLLRGYGDTVTPMVVMFGTVALNVILDPILIFGWFGLPEMGIQGAAVATIATRSLAFVVGLGILFSGRFGLKIRPQQMWPDPVYIRKMLRIGIPAAIDGMGRAVSVNLMLFIVGMFTTPVVAGYGIGVRIFSLIFLPASAVEQSVETMVGQNMGAGKPERARKTAHEAAKGMGVILSVVGVIVFIAAEPITALFTNDSDVLSVGAEFLRYVSLTFGGIGILRSYTGTFRGVGKTMVAAIISFTVLGLVRLPIAAVSVTQLGFGQKGIWLGFAISNVLGAVLGYMWFKRGTWREKTVIDETDSNPAPSDD